MKIGYRATGVGNYTTLADDTAGTPILDFRPSMDGVAQVSGVFRAENKRVWSRGNRVWSMSFAVSKQHASMDAALEFLATDAAAMPDQVDLKIEQGAKTVYMHRAVIVRYQPVGPVNLSTLIQYEFIGERFTTDYE